MKTTYVNWLQELEVPKGKIFGNLLQLMEEKEADESWKEKISGLLQNPEQYTDNTDFQHAAALLLASRNSCIELKEPVPFSVFGEEHIERGAFLQMETAVKLPVSVRGALMPDAHQGYGLPIGGVLATRNAVIPYGVGVDIGCRMSLSIFDINEAFYLDNEAKFKRELIAFTRFGAGNEFRGAEKANHEILEHESFKTIGLARQLRDKAWGQLGTSGGGNHFVEWGILEVHQEDETNGLRPGKYVSLLTHSGSRGLGAMLDNHYTQIAKRRCPLPKEAANLAYLSLSSEEGQEYWEAMNLAGSYASACHEVIHQRIRQAIGGEVMASVENHHNFAWKEWHNGEELIVHRKGATPASEGVLGIIPGSMTAPGFLVKGKGNPASLHSASHGAGRQMSRTSASKQFTRETLRNVLKEHEVTLIGGGLDEAPGAYKDIRQVMHSQQELVEVLATFHPKMVRMADDGSRED